MIDVFIFNSYKVDYFPIVYCLIIGMPLYIRPFGRYLGVYPLF